MSYEESNHLTFTAQADGSSVTLICGGNDTVMYEKGNEGWTTYMSGTTITLDNAGDTVSFKGMNITTNSFAHFSMTGTIAASGDVTSLTNGVGGDADLAMHCYDNMFSGCTSLITAPALPATTLNGGCYNSMFAGCTGLTAPPELPATTLTEYCYYSMFSGCTGLKISETKTGGYTKEWRIPTTGDATTEYHWNYEMLKETGGTFTGDPKENKTYYIYEDLAAPVISGIEDGKTYCETAEFIVTDADLATVTAKGADLTAVNGTYTLTEVGTYDVVATDVAGNSTTVTVTLNANHTYDDDCDADCNVCNETRTLQHSWNTEWSSDGTHHWHECSLCGEKKDNAAHTWDSGVITQAPTVTEKGVKTYTCTICGETKTEEIDKLAPSITEGNNGSHQKGSKDGLTFTSNASLADFVSVSVDGKVIDGKNYTLIEGSIIVTLTADYLDTLSVGKHTLAISSIYGTASTEFTITAKAVDPVIPATGDTGNVFMWSALLFVSCGALSALGISMKCKRANSK